MSIHELRHNNQPRPSLCYDGDLTCAQCGASNIEWHDVRVSAEHRSVIVRTRCEGCTRVGDLHVVWHKGSILTRWYVVAKRSSFDAPVAPIE